MNLPELTIFLLVTGFTGAGFGAIVGLFTGNVASAAKLGGMLGPVVAGVAITIWGIVVKLQSKTDNNKDRTTN